MAQNKKSNEDIIRGKLELLHSKSKGLIAKIPLDGLRLNRNLDQLYNILKKKNQVAKPISEEAKARDTFLLTERGFESSEFAQKIKGEKFILNRRREEKEIKKANQFFTALDSKYDINTYLNKYNDYMLYNLTDNAFIKGKDRIMKNGIMKIKEKWNKQVKDGSWKRINPINNKLTARSRFTTDRTNEEITGKKREYFQHIQSYVYVNYMKRDKSISPSNLCHHFISVNKEDNFVQDLWRIISAQVKVAEENSFFNEYSGSEGFELLTDVNASYLEEEFANLLGSASQSNDRYYQQYGIREEDRRYIEQEYLTKVDPNFVEKDNGMPIWAIVYLYFRAGKLYELKQFIDGYGGRLKGDMKAFDEDLHTYFQRNRKMDNRFAMNNLAGEKAVTGDIFQRMLFVILARHDKVPSEELISNMEDFLWFNLRVCKFQEDYDEDRDDIARTMTGYGTLIELQKKILDVEPKYLDNDGSNPFNYIKTLFLVCAYDEALKYMEQFEELQEEAVHFAIVLQEAGLLSLRKKYEETELSGAELMKPAEYHRIVLEYTNTFCKKNFIEALYYHKLILSSSFDPCSPDVIKKTLSGVVIKNSQVSKLFIEDRRKVNEIKEILGTKIFNEVVKQIGQHSKDSGLIFKLLESVNDYEGIFRQILEEEYKSYEKFKSNEIRNDKKAFAEITLKFKFLEEALKNYRYNSKGMTSRYFELIEFVKNTRALFTSWIGKDYKTGFEILKKLDTEKKVFGTDERKMQSEFLNKDEIEKACYLDIMLYGSKIIKGYIEMDTGSLTAEEKKDKNMKADFHAKRLKIYYNKVSPAFDMNRRELVEALKKEIEL